VGAGARHPPPWHEADRAAHNAHRLPAQHGLEKGSCSSGGLDRGFVGHRRLEIVREFGVEVADHFTAPVAESAVIGAVAMGHEHTGVQALDFDLDQLVVGPQARADERLDSRQQGPRKTSLAVSGSSEVVDRVHCDHGTKRPGRTENADGPAKARPPNENAIDDESLACRPEGSGQLLIVLRAGSCV
jgi:hypothetical protein